MQFYVNITKDSPHPEPELESLYIRRQQLQIITLVETFKIAAVIFHNGDLLFEIINYIVAVAEDAFEFNFSRDEH